MRSIITRATAQAECRHRVVSTKASGLRDYLKWPTAVLTGHERPRLSKQTVFSASLPTGSFECPDIGPRCRPVYRLPAFLPFFKLCVGRSSGISGDRLITAQVGGSTAACGFADQHDIQEGIHPGCAPLGVRTDGQWNIVTNPIATSQPSPRRKSAGCGLAAATFAALSCLVHPRSRPIRPA